MHKSLIGLLTFVLLFSFSAFAEAPDTLITLSEVSISARRQHDFGAGHSSSTIDSTILQQQSQQHLGYLLGRHSGIFIKSYGPGILASNSLRGGQPGQTALMWNGFSLQSPMNGQADLALMPVLFADEIQVQYGGGSALWGSGAMGGAIFINNHRSRQLGFSAEAGINTASIGDLGQSLKLSYGLQNFSTTLRFFNRNASNKYRFANTTLPGNPVEEQLLAGISQTGILHETWFRLGNNHQFDLRWWWQDNDRDIPPALDFTFYESRQKDQSLRLSGQWQMSLPRVLFFVRGARFEDYLDYSDNFDYVGNSYSTTLTGEAEARWNPRKGIIFNGGINLQDITAKADEYDQEEGRFSLALFASAKWEAIEESLELVVSGRQELVKDYEIPFAPAMGFSWKVAPQWAVKGNAGYSYLLPSLNALFWNPGGNPDLKPEQGWSGDLRLERKLSNGKNDKSFSPFQDVSIGGYHRNIKNWIIWLPQEDSWIWMPENRAEVRSYGIESRLGGHWQQGHNRLQWGVRYDHTIARNTKAAVAEDPSLDKQLIYVPRNRVGMNLAFIHKNLSLTYDHEINGKRFTNSDNSESLPAYHSGDAGLHWHRKFANYGLGLNLKVENIWNTRYQIIANRPMPLRFVRAGISFSFHQK